MLSIAGDICWLFRCGWRPWRAVLGAVNLMGLMTAWMLVALTFAMGVGAEMTMPTWAAVTPEIVPRSELQSVIALNSMGMNVARAIGPAIADVIVSAAGTGAVFVLNALPFLGVMTVPFLWKRQLAPTTLSAERFFVALRKGFRFARHHGPLLRAVIRGIGATCRWIDIPLPAPPKLVGALLVVAMTIGFVATDMVVTPG